MALKKFRPNTPGTRGLTLVDKKGLWNGKPVKSLTTGISKKGGRNNTGRITMRRKGGGHKSKYRIIDIKSLIHISIQTWYTTFYHQLTRFPFKLVRY